MNESYGVHTGSGLRYCIQSRRTALAPWPDEDRGPTCLRVHRESLPNGEAGPLVCSEVHEAGIHVADTNQEEE